MQITNRTYRHINGYDMEGIIELPKIACIPIGDVLFEIMRLFIQVLIFCFLIEQKKIK